MSDTAVTVYDYFDENTWGRIKAFSDTHETPFLVVDLATIDRQYDDMLQHFPLMEQQTTTLFLKLLGTKTMKRYHHIHYLLQLLLIYEN